MIQRQLRSGYADGGEVPLPIPIAPIPIADPGGVQTHWQPTPQPDPTDDEKKNLSGEDRKRIAQGIPYSPDGQAYAPDAYMQARVGLAAGGPVQAPDDADTIYPSTAPAWTAGGYASALGLAGNADQGYARGGPVRRGYDDGGEIYPEYIAPIPEQPAYQSDVGQAQEQPLPLFDQSADQPREQPESTPYQRVDELPTDVAEQRPEGDERAPDPREHSRRILDYTRRKYGLTPDREPDPAAIAAYTQGNNALPPNDLDVHLRHAADSDPDGNPGDHAVSAVTNPDLNPDGQAAVLAGLRQRYDSMITHAQGAMAHGDVPTAIELAQRAHDQVPDGQDLHLQTDGGDTVTATVHGPGGDVSHPMTLQQFHDYLVGPATSFDHVIENGLGRNLQIASGNSGTRETGSTPETAAPPQTGYGADVPLPQPRPQIERERGGGQAETPDVERQQMRDARRFNNYGPEALPYTTPKRDHLVRVGGRYGDSFPVDRSGALIRPDGTREYTPGYWSNRNVIDHNTGERLRMSRGTFIPRQPTAGSPYDEGGVRGSLSRPFGFSAADNAYKHLSASGALDVNPSDRYGRTAEQQAIEGARPWTHEMGNNPLARGQPPTYYAEQPQPYYSRTAPTGYHPPEPEAPPVPAVSWNQRNEAPAAAAPAEMPSEAPSPYKSVTRAPDGGYIVTPEQSLGPIRPLFGPGSGIPSPMMPDYAAIKRDPNGPEARAYQQFPMASQDRQRRDAIEKYRTQDQQQALEYEKLRSSERKGELSTEQKIRLEGLRQSGRLDVTNANNTAKDTRQQNWLAQKDRHLDFLQSKNIQTLAQQRLSATERNAITLYNGALNGGRDPPPNAKAAVQKLFGIAAQEGLETPGALPPQNAPTVQTAPTAQAPVAQPSPAQSPTSSATRKTINGVTYVWDGRGWTAQ